MLGPPPLTETVVLEAESGGWVTDLTQVLEDLNTLSLVSRTIIKKAAATLNRGEEWQTVTKRRDCMPVENPDSTRNSGWSVRGESNSRSQLGKLSASVGNFTNRACRLGWLSANLLLKIC
jgi:hypothetical protein